uniref:Uncharacterized protein n=1 Tax=Parascaris univalens TaxID=6257 RepID=A0A915A778_PARUN
RSVACSIKTPDSERDQPLSLAQSIDLYIQANSKQRAERTHTNAHIKGVADATDTFKYAAAAPAARTTTLDGPSLHNLPVTPRAIEFLHQYADAILSRSIISSSQSHTQRQM